MSTEKRGLPSRFSFPLQGSCVPSSGPSTLQPSRSIGANEVLIGPWRAPVPRRRARRWRLCLAGGERRTANGDTSLCRTLGSLMVLRLQGTAALQVNNGSQVKTVFQFIAPRRRSLISPLPQPVRSPRDCASANYGLSGTNSDNGIEGMTITFLEFRI